MPTSTVTVHPVAPDDEDALRAWHEAAAEVHHHDRPPAPFWAFAEMRSLLRPDDPERDYHLFVARDAAGTVVGHGLVVVPLLDNTDKVNLELAVTPAHRGHGIGDLLAGHALALAARAGAQVAIAEAYLPVDHDEGHPVRRFARRHGFVLANTEVRRTLQLPVPEATLQGWVDEAARHHQGYRLSTYDGAVPAELAPSLVGLFNQLAVDAPTGDIDFEAGRSTVATYRARLERVAASGRRLYETVAVKDGAVVAQSTLVVPPEGVALPHLIQWGTYVHREHRGRRLGLAVKAANLRHVQRRHPDRTLVSTANSPANVPMVAINELMGFRPVEVMAEFVRRL